MICVQGESLQYESYTPSFCPSVTNLPSKKVIKKKKVFVSQYLYLVSYSEMKFYRKTSFEAQ